MKGRCSMRKLIAVTLVVAMMMLVCVSAFAGDDRRPADRYLDGLKVKSSAQDLALKTTMGSVIFTGIARAFTNKWKILTPIAAVSGFATYEVAKHYESKEIARNNEEIFKFQEKYDSERAELRKEDRRWQETDRDINNKAADARFAKQHEELMGRVADNVATTFSNNEDTELVVYFNSSRGMQFVTLAPLQSAGPVMVPVGAEIKGDYNVRSKSGFPFLPNVFKGNGIMCSSTGEKAQSCVVSRPKGE